MTGAGHAGRKEALTEGTIVDKVLLFALPLMITSMLQQLFNATDVAVVGRFASKEAMAAVGSNAPIVSLLVNFFVGISVGANVLIARNIGAKNIQKAKSAVGTAMAAALASGVIVAVIGNVIAVPLINLLGVPPEVRDYSVTYLRIYFSGVPFIMLYNFEAAIFRSDGNTRAPLICLFTGGVFNVAANLFFVLVLDMDVDGVAIATVLANVISSGMMLHFLRRESGVLRVEYRDIRINRSDLSMMLRIGLPAGLQSAVFSISNICVQSAINSLGADYMAASSAAFNIEIFCFFVVNSFTQTLVTFVGQNYGAGKYERCREIVRKTLLLSWALVMAVSVVLLLSGKALLGLFTDDPFVIEAGMLRVRMLLYAQTLNVLMDNLSGAMRGLGKSLVPALTTLFCVCGIRILWVFTGFRFYHTWLSILIIFPVSWVVNASFMVIGYLRVRNRLLPAEN
ncbi:MAG: MATE family efflux transporter [Mogibacterium sp.]|nr:MATE family efflux transporter [Mogibacterium sp.]